jgi:hypothetical protein
MTGDGTDRALTKIPEEDARPRQETRPAEQGQATGESRVPLTPQAGGPWNFEPGVKNNLGFG